MHVSDNFAIFGLLHFIKISPRSPQSWKEETVPFIKNVAVCMIRLLAHAGSCPSDMLQRQNHVFSQVGDMQQGRVAGTHVVETKSHCRTHKHVPYV